MNLPDRYVRVLGDSVRVDLVEAGPAYAARASFRRMPQRQGTSLQLFGHLEVPARGRLSVGNTAGQRARPHALS